jgi:hypothetical protein
MEFKQKVSKSFESVKNDVETFKQSMNDWIVFLDHSQRDTKTQVRELERRVRQLESEKELKEFD